MRNVTLKSIALVSTLVMAGVSSVASANEQEQKKQLETELKQQITKQTESVTRELQQELKASVNVMLTRFAPELPKSLIAKTK